MATELGASHWTGRKALKVHLDHRKDTFLLPKTEVSLIFYLKWMGLSYPSTLSIVTAFLKQGSCEGDVVTAYVS